MSREQFPDVGDHLDKLEENITGARGGLLKGIDSVVAEYTYPQLIALVQDVVAVWSRAQIRKHYNSKGEPHDLFR